LINELNEIAQQCGGSKKPEVESTIGSDETGRDDLATKPTTTKVNSRVVEAVGARDFIDEIDFLDHGSTKYGQAVSPFDVKTIN